MYVCHHSFCGLTWNPFIWGAETMISQIERGKAQPTAMLLVKVLARFRTRTLSRCQGTLRVATTAIRRLAFRGCAGCGRAGATDPRRRMRASGHCAFTHGVRDYLWEGSDGDIPVILRATGRHEGLRRAPSLSPDLFAAHAPCSRRRGKGSYGCSTGCRRMMLL